MKDCFGKSTMNILGYFPLNVVSMSTCQTEGVVHYVIFSFTSYQILWMAMHLCEGDDDVVDADCDAQTQQELCNGGSGSPI